MPGVKMDHEMKAYAEDERESIAQAKRGEFARVNAPADITVYRARGRPVGSIKDDAKISSHRAVQPRCVGGIPRHGRRVANAYERCFERLAEYASPDIGGLPRDTAGRSAQGRRRN